MNHRADSLKKNLVEISMKPRKNKKGWLLSHTRATCTGTNQPKSWNRCFPCLRADIRTVDVVIFVTSMAVNLR
jgi:hypothetical protein